VAAHFVRQLDQVSFGSYAAALADLDPVHTGFQLQTAYNPDTDQPVPGESSLLVQIIYGLVQVFGCQYLIGYKDRICVMLIHRCWILCMSPELYYSIEPDWKYPFRNRVAGRSDIHYAIRSGFQSVHCLRPEAGRAPRGRAGYRLQIGQVPPSIPYRRARKYSAAYCSPSKS